ncbi:hypothetical protein Acy02nite_81710 [Actinoplanes cyaneus]|uniref:Transposase IS701-like DDE domain-containing protein n=1 Tax=Actinoplanes cyaneus TaxID=52696 RepID=A0A919IQE0_9ACTN|nr:DDE superfamily endonuclease [Actinoplanes cyaneus]GID70290.1 hypothetical protein Acy02nite_81710 [Actinoplanes cyaneus]
MYLPKSWIIDRQRCDAAGVPDDAPLLTKPRVAIQMLQRAIDARVPFTWFTADEAFGQVKYLRTWLQERDVFHVVATRCNDEVCAHDIGHGRADEYAHITLSMLALAWLAAVRAAEQQKGAPTPTASNSCRSAAPKPAG